MFNIGDFARLGRVSVRMLRHYDAIGLLPPAAVDPATGYRSYRVDQLGRLNRIIALKDLGFTLEQVERILDDRLDPAELRGMLRLRRAQLEERITADAARLAGVEARLRMIESEGHMGTEDVVVKRVDRVRIAELSAVADSYAPEDITPTIQPLYGELMRRLDVAGIRPTGYAIAHYGPADTSGGDAVLVHAGIQVDGGAGDFDVVDLPPIELAATIIHRGSMAGVEATVQVLARWIEDNGYRTDGFAREVYLDYDPDRAEQGVTELQMQITRN